MPKLTGSDKSDSQLTKNDILLWAVVVGLLLFGLWANYHYANYDWAIRAAGWIILACLCLGVASLTTHGQQGRVFIRDAQRELKRVVWPTRQETIKTMFVVVAIVILMAFLLWGIDTLLFWLIGKIMSA